MNKSDLGKGAYGSVKLVKEKGSDKLYAMKALSKREIKKYQTFTNLKREIKI